MLYPGKSHPPIDNTSGMNMPSRKQSIKDILMIIDFSLSRNNYHEILKFYGDWSYQCPVCGAKHHLVRHGSYERYLIFPGDDTALEYTCMTVLRLKCTSCSATHAVLPMDIIPFHQFSVQAVLIQATCGWPMPIKMHVFPLFQHLRLRHDRCIFRRIKF